MKKVLMLFLPLLAVGCVSKVAVKDIEKYKCGAAIISTKYLSDDSYVVNIDGRNNVLTHVVSESGDKYENIATGLVLWKKDGDTFLQVKGKNFPQCKLMVD